MKELKILGLLIVIVGVTYWGIEPLAHGIMHKHIEEAIHKHNLPDYQFSDLGSTPPLDGDPAKGKEAFQMFCASCHGMKADGINPPMDTKAAASSFGVVPPDLSNFAYFTDEKFLFHFIKDPAKASEFQKISMPPMGLSDEQVADIIAYMKSKAQKIEGAELFKEACGRCHGAKYQKIYAETPPEDLKRYMGKVPPDLSIIMKAKGEHYLVSFINKPQALLPGTSMPRVGLNQEATEELMKYLDEISDPHKEQRQKIGIIVLVYMLVMVGLTYAWKRKIWKNIH